MSITFKEDTPYVSDTTYGKRTLAPVYMVKDGKEYFVQNRVLADNDRLWGTYEIRHSDFNINKAKEFLESTDGAYLYNYGGQKDPLAMLKRMTEKGYTFTDPDNMFVDCRNRSGFVDFHGNMNEVSAAFRYRFYDMDLLKEVYAAALPLIQKSLEKRRKQK